MLGVVCTMYDVLSWGGETQALIYNPDTGKVYGINALGVAPTGATPEFFKDQEMDYPPASGPLAAVTPGTPGGLMVMLAEFGTMSLKDVLEPAIQMADGYPIERSLANQMERQKERIKEWPYSTRVFLPHLGEEREAPHPGEIFRQPDLKRTLEKLVEAEQLALAEGKSRKEAIYAAYDRFYRGDIAAEFVRGSQEQGGLHTMEDLANWEVYVEEPVMATYRGIDVYKLTSWVQGPVMLQALNMMEEFDVKGMEYNSAEYIHTLYQVMNLAFADRDFYYGDPYFPPDEPLEGLLSKEYAKDRLRLFNREQNDPDIKPGDPYPFQGGRNPYLHLLEKWSNVGGADPESWTEAEQRAFDAQFAAGTTAIQSADKSGWVVSITPSGGWMPACIAGNTGVGMSQRMQSFVLDEAKNPYNVLEPGKRPRATLTPAMALKDGRPFLSFSVQGGDQQDQHLLQLFLNMVEFEMDVQQACEAANFISSQMQSSFGEHVANPGRLTLNRAVTEEVRAQLEAMGYEIRVRNKTSGPLMAIWFDWKNGTMWGGASDYGDDYGIAW
jgi:gamma-glutamyltranspeptidase/glutathione hydrolase